MTGKLRFRTIDPALFEIDYDAKTIRVVDGEPDTRRVTVEPRVWSEIGDVKVGGTVMVYWPPHTPLLDETKRALARGMAHAIGPIRPATEIGTVLEILEEELVN